MPDKWPAYWPPCPRLGPPDYRSEFAKKHLAKGLKQGLEQGLEQGRVQALLAVLEARGLEASSKQLEQLRSCTDLDRLDGWIRRAAVANSVSELFE